MKKENFKDKRIARLAAWIVLTVFAISLSFTILLFNIKNVFNEKSLKNIGTKAISDLLEKDREKVLENYDILQEFARLAPEEELNVPTGIQNFTLKIKGKDIAGLSKDDFFIKLPSIITENTYDSYIGNLTKENSQNKTMVYSAIMNELKGKKNNQGQIFIYVTFATFIISFILLGCKKAFLRTGLIVSSVSVPIYIMFYLFQPFIEATIRRTNFVFAGFMVSDLLSKLAFNYLLFSLIGVALITIGIVVRIDFKELIPKKKGEYEKVIKTK